jgi:hypothetical protein
VRHALRRTGRAVGQVLLFPFRVIGWALRGVGHALKFVFEIVGEVLEAVVK